MKIIEGYDDTYKNTIWDNIKENKNLDCTKWSNTQISKKTPANIIAFKSSRANSCASYIGYDIRGNIVSVVTDFFVMSDFFVDEEDLLKK